MTKKIAVLVENDYEDQEFWYPYLRMKEEGYDVYAVGPEFDIVFKSKHGYPVKSTICRFDGSKEDWAAVIIPGGWAPDKLRRYPEMLDLVKKSNEQGAVIAAICHAGSLLVSADILKGKTVTSYDAIKDDMVNAGAKWVDEEVVTDGNLITSRTPNDLPEFVREIVKALKK